MNVFISTIYSRYHNIIYCNELDTITNYFKTIPLKIRLLYRRFIIIQKTVFLKMNIIFEYLIVKYFFKLYIQKIIGKLKK